MGECILCLSKCPLATVHQNRRRQNLGFDDCWQIRARRRRLNFDFGPNREMAFWETCVNMQACTPKRTSVHCNKGGNGYTCILSTPQCICLPRKAWICGRMHA